MLLFVGVVAGGFLLGSRKTETALLTQGWCCIRKGGDCQQEATMQQCLGSSGIMFSVSRRTCNTVCSSLPQDQ